ncbi:hypothetical protein H1R17_06890 [Flavobacterium sp. xlx-214]|uniref:YiiX/YebB-like N1pC/P60 family cysteine hydrolase n=1 Tax=unclassified Flavobacterium TaxID=196869 RepID=UPI0013D09E6C|nr:MULTISPECIES: YiiX/YebB-like N1pC/P60 family cysteine hydrolase [unclassified Flavobacterium]MBA5793857.1 hypothetical protein [Flavobacterium sp. xlx-221]QMI84841.1 hypothetical protein H1R17_06890 [Flavobacterium sp. xlx-214]
MKNILFFLLFSITTFAQKNTLKSGDLLFINIDCGEMCDAINAVTQGYKGNDFNHMGLVVATAKNEYYVYEAIGKEVVKTPLDTFLSYTQKPVYVGSLKKKYRYFSEKAIQFCEEQLGVPYDSDFLYDNGKYYCSELIYDAFKFANNNQPFFKLFPMTYKEPNANTFFPVWVTHFKKQGIEIPEGKLGCNPGGMSLDKKIKLRLYINK